MPRNNVNLKAYLYGNATILCILLAGIYHGNPPWDLQLRLPNLLLILVLLNTVLIFREVILEGEVQSTKKKHPSMKAVEDLRRVLADRTEINDTLLPDSLKKLQEMTGSSGMILFQVETAGKFSLLATAGDLPPHLQAPSLMVKTGYLVIKYSSNAGEENITKWGKSPTSGKFTAKVGDFNGVCVPLTLFGNVKAVCFLMNPDKSFTKKSGVAGLALFLECMLALSLSRSQAENGQYIDSQTGLLRFEAFNDSFETEVERSERYNQSMTLLSLQITPFENLSTDQHTALQKAVATAMRQSLRRLDLMFGGKSEACFCAILTETNTEVANLVSERIIAAFDKQVAKQEILSKTVCKLFIGHATYPTDATHGHGLSEKAEEALTATLGKEQAILSYSRLRDTNI